MKKAILSFSIVFIFSCASFSAINKQNIEPENEAALKSETVASKKNDQQQTESISNTKSSAEENDILRNANSRLEEASESIPEKEDEGTPAFIWQSEDSEIKKDLDLYHKIKWFIKKEKYEHALKLINEKQKSLFAEKNGIKQASIVMNEPLYLIYLQKNYILLKIKNFDEYNRSIKDSTEVHRHFIKETSKYEPLNRWNHAVYLRRDLKIEEDQFVQILKKAVMDMRTDYWQGSYLYLHMQRKLVYRYYLDKLPDYNYEKKVMYRRFWLLGMSYNSFARYHTNHMTYLLPVFLKKDRLGLTLLEKKRIKYFTEMYKYSFQKHSNDVRARTFPNRQKDSNIFMSAVYDNRDRGGFWDSLRAAYRSEDKKNLFIDIGPGLANRFFSCVSSIELARENPHLKIIALDLPSQVERFYRVVPARVKQKLYNHKNIIIIGADGTKPLKSQIENYATKKRKAEPLNSKKVLSDTRGVFIRAANSIDVYYKWNVLEELMFSIKNDFVDQPIVIFMNRLILYKPADDNNFRYIGQLSPWGFNHWTSRLDRKGQAPFTLFLDL